MWSPHCLVSYNIYIFLISHETEEDPICFKWGAFGLTSSFASGVVGERRETPRVIVILYHPSAACRLHTERTGVFVLNEQTNVSLGYAVI